MLSFVYFFQEKKQQRHGFKATFYFHTFAHTLTCTPHTTGMSSTAYAAAQAEGASKATMDLFDELQVNSPTMNYGMVHSAATSSEVVSRMAW